MSTPTEDICPHTGLVRGADGTWRPAWATTQQLRDYYDDEWGTNPTGMSGPAALEGFSEDELFERLSLESFQAGLSWALVLSRRQALRRAFHHFHVDRVATMGEEDVQRLLTDATILRNERKIRAVVTNARATQDLREHGGLAQLIARHSPPAAPPPTHTRHIQATSSHSAALAAELKACGFTFVGPTTIHALFQALGIINDRVPPHPTRGAGDSPHQ